MQRFDRYLLRQLLVHFGFFSLVLVGVYWVNRAVVLFDRLIADGHSAGIFVEFTVLWLPSVVAMVLPMASFAAAVYVTNQMSNDSEVVVMQSAGVSPWRLGRAVAMFGLLLCLAMLILSHVLVPASREQLRLREAQISGSVTARLLREGTFLHPTSGVTFYIRDISAEGELRDVLLSDRRQPGREVTYTADRAYLLRDDQGPKLVMAAGMAQTLNLETRRLSTTTFQDLTYDVSALVTTTTRTRRKLDFIPTWELMTRGPEISEETRNPLGEINEELHSRFQQPLLSLVAAMIGYAALIAGGFSRFGVTRHIVVAIFYLVLVKLTESVVTEPVRSTPGLWPLTYLPTVVGLGIAATLLWRAARPFRKPRHEAVA